MTRPDTGHGNLNTKHPRNILTRLALGLVTASAPEDVTTFIVLGRIDADSVIDAELAGIMFLGVTVSSGRAPTLSGWHWGCRRRK